MRAGTRPGVTADIWHELMVWDMAVGTRGQKAGRVGGPGDARPRTGGGGSGGVFQRPVTHVAAGRARPPRNTGPDVSGGF